MQNVRQEATESIAMKHADIAKTNQTAPLRMEVAPEGVKPGSWQQIARPTSVCINYNLYCHKYHKLNRSEINPNPLAVNRYASCWSCLCYQRFSGI